MRLFLRAQLKIDLRQYLVSAPAGKGNAPRVSPLSDVAVAYLTVKNAVVGHWAEAQAMKETSRVYWALNTLLHLVIAYYVTSCLSGIAVVLLCVNAALVLPGLVKNGHVEHVKAIVDAKAGAHIATVGGLLGQVNGTIMKYTGATAPAAGKTSSSAAAAAPASSSATESTKSDSDAEGFEKINKDD